MKYKGIVLLLDNFRQILKDYTVDIQDIVRSAILDGVDIEKYIRMCKSEPFKLDQIRLYLKEGYTFPLSGLSGEGIYKLRELLRNSKNADMSLVICNQLSRGILSDEHVDYMIKWLKSGCNISSLPIADIPSYLLETVSVGVLKGLDMGKYLKAAIKHGYSKTTVSNLVKLELGRHDTSRFLKERWSEDAIESFALRAGVHTGAVKAVYDIVTPEDSGARISSLLGICGVYENIKYVKDLQKTLPDGTYVYSMDYLIRIGASLSNIKDLGEVLKYTNLEEAKEVIYTQKDSVNKRISGSFRKGGKISS